MGTALRAAVWRAVVRVMPDTRAPIGCDETNVLWKLCTMPNGNIRINVALLDRHKMLLDGLSQWLDAAGDDIEVCAAVVSWGELLAHPKFPVDVVVTELDFDDHIPLELKIGSLAEIGVRTLIMSAFSSPDLIRKALDAGAAGYVLKSEETATIANAIVAVARGQIFVSPGADTQINPETMLTPPTLSAAERQVVGLYARGLSLRGAAAQLGLKDETAKTYLKRARGKYSQAGIDVGSKIALRSRAIADGLIDVRPANPEPLNGRPRAVK